MTLKFSGERELEDLRTTIAMQVLSGIGIWSPNPAHVRRAENTAFHKARAEFAVAAADALIAELEKEPIT